MTLARRIGLAIVFIWFFGGGIGHFVVTDFFAGIVPPWVPWPRAVVYISGVAEIVLAIGVLLPAWRSLAGWGLIVLTLAVTPANLHMVMNPQLFPDFPPAVLWVRMVVQVALLACIWWSTRPLAPSAHSAPARAS